MLTSVLIAFVSDGFSFLFVQPVPDNWNEFYPLTYIKVPLQELINRARLKLPLHPVRALQPVLETETVLGSISIKGSSEAHDIESFLHMCGKLWSECHFLNVTLCLKDSVMMKVEELWGYD